MSECMRIGLDFSFGPILPKPHDTFNTDFGGLRLYLFTDPDTHMLDILSAPIVVILDPENPMRLLLACLRREIHKRPLAIICAPAGVDTEFDPACLMIDEWLEKNCTVIARLDADASEFGEIALHVLTEGGCLNIEVPQRNWHPTRTRTP